MVNEENLSGNMITADYLDQFKNDALLEKLAEMPLSRVEDSLMYYEDKYSLSLRKRNPRRQSASLFLEHWPERIFNRFVEVKKTLDSFVEVKDPNHTPFSEIKDREDCGLLLDYEAPGGTGEYNHLSRTVTIGCSGAKSTHLHSALSLLTVVLAHEYGHHLVDSLFTHTSQKQRREFRLFDEGMAFGLERTAADVFAKKYCSPAFLHFALPTTINDLETAQELFIRKSEERIPSSLLGYFFSYSYGNVLFAVLEAERGPEIYKQILQGKFKW